MIKGEEQDKDDDLKGFEKRRVIPQRSSGFMLPDPRIPTGPSIHPWLLLPLPVSRNSRHLADTRLRSTANASTDAMDSTVLQREY